MHRTPILPPRHLHHRLRIRLGTLHHRVPPHLASGVRERHVPGHTHDQDVSCRFPLREEGVYRFRARVFGPDAVDGYAAWLGGVGFDVVEELLGGLPVEWWLPVSELSVQGTRQDQ